MDEMYLKMILALTDEFFEYWEWAEGDKFISYIWKHGEEVPNPIINTIGNSCIVDEKIGSWLFGEFVEYSCKTRPVLNQEQLQKLSGLDWDLYYHDLVKNYSEYDSAEQAGLAMIMYMKYGKEWDGEKWL